MPESGQRYPAEPGAAHRGPRSNRSSEPSIETGGTAVKKIAISLSAIAVAVVACVAGWNYAVLQRPLDAVIADDPRNANLAAKAHFSGYVQPDEIVFDLRTVGTDKAPVDVFRVFLQFAKSLEDRSFERVILAHRGVAKVQVDGAYFQQLGREYSTQNPVYTMRTFPEHVFRPDGTQAFDQWSGGLLGVLQEQMGDFMEFHEQWYLSDISGSN
jgi:hypothetical protein